MSIVGEKVRLVIWDLDETFWGGTLTEGGIELRPDHIELVKDLARRGIMSSILSKNSLVDVKTILTEAGIWDFFIFPSLNWEPKGPRLNSLLEAVQLRASSVMFIDDNPLNLKEAQYYVPNIQVSGPELIPQITNYPAFLGKDDKLLTRLQQYKLLEQRKADETRSGSDVSGFLRSSDIRVEFEFEIEKEIDRAVELINRTNQLNFTKRRLSEDVDVARSQLRQILSEFGVNGALIRVRDRYGDHGFCGIYIQSLSAGLLHFCFSCRILGMGIEQWLYARLGCPPVKIVGEVLTDLHATIAVDWINQESRGGEIGEVPVVLSPEWIRARGGCDLNIITHHFRSLTDDIHLEHNISRHGFEFRLDHSIFFRYARQGITNAQLRAALRLGYLPEDFTSPLSSPKTGRGLVLLSLWMDYALGLYRHRESGLTVPFVVPSGGTRSSRTDSRPTCEELRHRESPWLVEVLKILIDEYEFVGPLSEQEYQENLALMLSGIDRSTRVFVLGINDKMRVRHDATLVSQPGNEAFNRWTREVLYGFSNACFLDLRQFVHEEAELHDWAHFDRLVYLRVFQHIKERLECVT